MTPYVSDHLRGDAGTTMVLKVLRPSTGKKMTLKIQREAIQLPYLPYYGVQKDGVGYINYNQFVEGSAKDVRRAVLDMKNNGMTSLVLDLPWQRRRIGQRGYTDSEHVPPEGQGICSA